MIIRALKAAEHERGYYQQTLAGGGDHVSYSRRPSEQQFCRILCPQCPDRPLWSPEVAADTLGRVQWGSLLYLRWHSNNSRQAKGDSLQDAHSIM